MAKFFNLIGESPFAALKAHGETVHRAIGLLKDLFDAALKGATDRLSPLADQVANLETEADQIQDRLHEQLSARVLVPVNKGELFRMLEAQDSMADRAEDIAAMLTFRPLQLPGDLTAPFLTYVDAILANCRLHSGVLSRLDLLVESSFSGRDALTVSKLITELSEAEDQVKGQQVELNRKLFSVGDSMAPTETLLCWRIIECLADLSKSADQAAAGIRLMLRDK